MKAFRIVLRWGAYPLVFGGCALAMMGLLQAGRPYWPASATVVAAGLLCIALLEWVQPLHREWLRDCGDTVTDLWHSLVNLGVIQLTAALVGPWLAAVLPSEWRVFPRGAPVWVQLAIVALVLDLSLYAVHLASHRSRWLWRYHAAHHSAPRLYWLNGERRHPLHAVMMAAPGLTVLLASGVAPAVLAAWLGMLTVHLAFQHANVDYTLGPMRAWIGGAELHRWHHKREFEDAQVNFGEFLLLWDRIFGTFYTGPRAVGPDDVGLHDRGFPASYAAQLAYPFRRADARGAAEPAGPR